MSLVFQGECRGYSVADFHSVGASWMEGTSRRRVDRAGDIVRKGLIPTFVMRIGDRHRRKQRPCVGMERVRKECICISKFHYLTQVHYRDSIADMANNAQVVADEEVGQSEIFLKILKEIEYLRLNRDIKRGHRFVSDHKIGID